MTEEALCTWIWCPIKKGLWSIPSSPPMEKTYLDFTVC